MSNYKPVSRLLSSSNGDLKSLVEQAHFLRALTLKLREAIDPVLADHITLINIRDDTAVVAADTPAWLSKIRYMAPTILATLRHQSGLASLRHIQLKVQPGAEINPPNQGNNEHASRRATLSSASSNVLESAASGIRDPELASALRRLSRQKHK